MKYSYFHHEHALRRVPRLDASVVMGRAHTPDSCYSTQTRRVTRAQARYAGLHTEHTMHIQFL